MGDAESLLEVRVTKRRKAAEPRRYWSEEDLQKLRQMYPSQSTAAIAKALGRTLAAIYGTAKTLGLAKTQDYLKAECRLKKGSGIGREFRFPKGHAPANKGLRRPGWSPGRMKETQFKKGQMAGAARKKWKPIGTIMADHEGFFRIKVRERIPNEEHGWNSNVWPLFHWLIWEQHKGPIPPKHIVTFKDRDRSNCSIENLELISMAENARRNNMWRNLPRELAEVIQLKGALKRKLRRLDGKKQTIGPERSLVRDT